MSYTVKKSGHASWDDLKGKTISFKWSDGWEDYDPMMVFHETQPYEEMGQNRYYIMDADGGGYAVWESAEIEVTVHEEPRARGGVDAWLDEQPTVGYTGNSDAARNAAIERAARFFGKRPWWLENMVDAILKAYKEADN